ncbi:TonB-dependent receptor [Novosphingobium rosa]|uniref:TonB-dependent receptor n=1 Tax=Novosphingobium rosa TaxID=76978 RepID=UPI0008365941|nr:TonB-dependent receptor [Novosphingobium rosa]
MTTALATAFLAPAVVVTPAFAETATQPAAAPEAAVGEIVVTAQHREENLQKVPIAVTALGGAALRSMGLNRSTDIAKLTPGVSISASSGGENAQYTMRGVTQNDYSQIAEGPIAVYLDDSYIPNLQGQNFGFYDMERVEVLKGPQGILFGRNATGGLVNYVIAKPTEHLSGYANATYGSYGTARFEGALSGPLSDTLSARASFLFDRNGDYWRNVAGQSTTSTVSPCCHDLGEKRNLAARLQLEYRPNSDLSIRFMGSINRQRYSNAAYGEIGSRAVTNAAGNVTNTVFVPTDALGFTPPDIEKRQIASDLARDNQDYSYSNDANIHVDYNLGGGTHLISITSYRRFWSQTLFDADASPSNFLNFGSKGHAQNWSEELRLQGASDRVTWSTGLYLLDIVSNFNVGLQGPVNSLYAGLFGASATGIDTVNFAHLNDRSGSLFGQIEYKITPTLSLVGGLRGVLEHQDFDYSQAAYTNPDPYVIDTNPAHFLYSFNQDYHNSRSESLWSGKAQVVWSPDHDTMFYAGVNRGVKSGNYNVLLAGNNLNNYTVPYGAETLIAYEAGAKLTFWGGKARFNAAAYYYDYKNYQAYSSRGLVTYVVNKPARNYGVEGSLTLKPVPNFQIDMSGSLLSAKVKNVQVSSGLPEQTVDTPFAPHQQAAVVASYTLPGALAKGDIILSGNYTYQSGTYTNNQNFSNQWIPGYSLVGASVRWRDQTGKFDLNFTANNIFDKRYLVTLVDLTSVCGCTEAAYGTPQWFTISAGYHF